MRTFFRQLLLLPVAFLLALSPLHARAQTMQWANAPAAGNLNPIATASTVRCTLLVIEPDPAAHCDRFLLQWTGTGPLSTPHLDSLAAPPPPPELAVRRLGRTFDCIATARAETTEFVLLVDPTCAYSIIALPVRNNRVIAHEFSPQTSPYLTINGGVMPTHFPPAVTECTPIEAQTNTYLLRGWGFMQLLNAATIPAPYLQPQNSAGLSVISDSVLTIQIAAAPSSPHPTILQLTDSLGLMAAAVLPSSSPRLPTLSVILHPGADTPALSQIPGIASVTDMSTTLSSPPINMDESPHTNLYWPEYYPPELTLTLLPGADTTAIRSQLLANPNVASVDDVTSSPLPFAALPNDPRIGELWYLYETSNLPHTWLIPDVDLWPGASINAEHDSLWTTGTPPDTLRIGIIDTGISGECLDTHLPFSAMEYWRDFSGAGTDGTVDANYFGHGTAVAGLAAAVSNNGIGMASPAGPLVEPVSLRYWYVYNTDGWTAIANAINYARTIPGLRIATLAFGGPLRPPGAPSTGFDLPSHRYRLIAQTLKNASRDDILFIGAMGSQADSIPQYPAAFSDFVLAVGATSWTGQIWRDSDLTPFVVPGTNVGSAIGSWVDAVAPGGRGIPATAVNLGFGTDPVRMYSMERDYAQRTPNRFDVDTWAFGGTSATTGIVAGAAAALMRLKPQLTAEDVGQVLLRSARDAGSPGFDVQHGNGRIDLSAAVTLVASPNTVFHGSVGGSGSTPLTILDSVAVSFTLIGANYPLTDGTYAAVRYHLGASADFSSANFNAEPHLWIRRTQSWGVPSTTYWDDDVSSMWAGIASQYTSESCAVETYVYRLGGRWYPVPPESATIAFTAIGEAPPPLAVSTQLASEATLNILVRSSQQMATLRVAGLKRAHLAVDIYDLAGRHLNSLYDGVPASEQVELNWDGTHDATRTSGIFFVRATQGGTHATAKVVLLR
ncbi:MAG: S8 family serine peptidase [Candidatus Eisenbacteria bacterium]|nr:S8 family serine peptidase [Candidatus Eisenbacteria bacterium]